MEQIVEALSQYNHEGRTPLQLAVFRGDFYLVSFFLSLGADITQLTSKNSQYGSENILSLALSLPHGNDYYAKRKVCIMKVLCFYLAKTEELNSYIERAITKIKTDFLHPCRIKSDKLAYLQQAKDFFVNFNTWENWSQIPGHKISWVSTDGQPYTYCSLCTTIQPIPSEPTELTTCINCFCEFLPPERYRTMHQHRPQRQTLPPPYIPKPIDGE